MCLILDTNVFGPFFDVNNEHHSEFAPALAWVLKGRGKLVYGGTKYKNEMRCAKKYLRMFTALDRAGKLVGLNDESVDEHQAVVESLVDDGDFDDPHIIAIIRESGCCVVCTGDKRAIPFLKTRHLYPSGINRPKIYQRARNATILVDANIADICKPSTKLRRTVIPMFDK